jgi:hypothetical protein
MNAADEIEGLFSGGITAESLGEARVQADDAVAELLNEVAGEMFAAGIGGAE